MALTFLIGGARSGKSSLAVRLAEREHRSVTYVATAPALDDDMRARIDRHRAERPAEWSTVEEQIALDAALAAVPADAIVIVDCLTLWVSNMMWAGRSDADVIGAATAAAAAAAARPASTIVISNEVGLGVHPETDLGRRYRDLLGWVNQHWAAAADSALLLVAGRALPLADPLSLLHPRQTGRPV